MNKDIITDYLNVINTLENKYCSDTEVSPLAVKLLYRGVSNCEYMLLPSVMRGYKRYSREETILQRFIKEASVYRNDIREDDYLKWAEIAQHFGAPTRLLDWTSNPLVALYFACCGNADKNATVWLLHPFNYYHLKNSIENNDTEPLDKLICKLIRKNGTDDSLPQYPGIYVPNYTDLRMSDQAGYFMYWGSAEKALENLIPTESYMSVNEDNTELSMQCLYPYSVPAESKSEVLHKLDRLGINEKFIYPGLDGVGRYIEHYFRSGPEL